MSPSNRGHEQTSSGTAIAKAEEESSPSSEVTMSNNTFSPSVANVDFSKRINPFMRDSNFETPNSTSFVGESVGGDIAVSATNQTHQEQDEGLGAEQQSSSEASEVAAASSTTMNDSAQLVEESDESDPNTSVMKTSDGRLSFCLKNGRAIDLLINDLILQ